MTARLIDIPTLETERLTLRGPRMEDFGAWSAFAASDRARFIGGPFDVGKGWRAFAHVAGQWALRGYGSFIFCLRGSDAPLGMCGPWHPAEWPEKEIGWSIWDAGAEGKGFAYEAAREARRFAYQVLGWTTAVSYVDKNNDRSVALAERLGATLDESAARPEGPADMRVYRHPAPEAL